MGKKGKAKRRLKKLLKNFKPNKTKCDVCEIRFECDFCERIFCIRIGNKCAFTTMMYHMLFDGIEGMVCQQCLDDGISGEPLQRWYTTDTRKQITKQKWEKLQNARKASK